MSETNVPQPSFGQYGFLAPAPAAVLQGVQLDWQAAWGGGLVVLPSTPQGQCMASQAAILNDCYTQFLTLTYRIDPAYADGLYQDAIGRLSPGGAFARIPGTATQVTVNCLGAAGTVIAPGATIIDTSTGYTYTASTGGTIAASGTLSTLFTNTALGPLVCDAQTSWQIAPTLPGLSAIQNPATGVIGQNVETRAQFESRRQQSLALNSVNTNQAICAALLSVPGVTNAVVYDNSSGTTQTVNGVAINPNSLYCCVDGGDGPAVAAAIWSKKPPGCGYTGNVTYPVTDNTYQTSPPSYNVTFQQAAQIPVIFGVTIKNNALVPANAQMLIAQALAPAFNGNATAAPGIAANLFASQYYALLVGLGGWLELEQITLGCQNSASSVQFTASITGTSMIVSALSSGGTLAVNMALVLQNSAALANGTYITAQTGGSGGGAGTYTVSNNQTLASSVFYAINPTSNSVSLTAAQVPVFDDNGTSTYDVYVTLV